MTIKVRDYEVRLTRTSAERKQVRQLRYDIFVEEEGASATEEQKQLHEEYDSYDRFADYMGVFHNDKLVGTYRIIDRNAAEKMGGFYTETEFNISKIKKASGNIAEMSRACVNKEYRENGLVMRMLWLGLGEYVAKNKITVIFGVASWVGKNPVESAHAISYIYYNHLSPLKLRATVCSEKFVSGVNPKLSRMNILPEVFVDESLARKQMTPLVKGYLRMGATFGKGVFLDVPFNSYDLFVTLQTKNITAAYQKHFAGSETAFEHLGLKDGKIKTLGKIMLMPVTGPFKMLRAFVQFLMRDDAADVEFIEDPKEPKAEEQMN
ncbi:MAG: GNAT family N-acetyltransferase [Alphaproteobacteria bacterium]|nr:GNAT family N-acetyltransferase [Alphaproteobacteria bacterium]MBN2675463.1 GNAT family N-acetyltransferase [Alphaproteobacteria bacterium]